MVPLHSNWTVTNTIIINIARTDLIGINVTTVHTPLSNGVIKQYGRLADGQGLATVSLYLWSAEKYN